MSSKIKNIFKAVKGQRNRSKNCKSLAIRAYHNAVRHELRSRKQKKRDFKSLWVQRVNAAAREQGMKYSTFRDGLKKANIELNSKVLAEIAIHDKPAFAGLIEKAKNALVAA